jgi:hypothetical protein
LVGQKIIPFKITENLFMIWAMRSVPSWFGRATQQPLRRFRYPKRQGKRKDLLDCRGPWPSP